MRDADDSACLAALAAQIGHVAPFSSAEMAQVTTLTVTHARSLAPLSACTGLRHLRIVGSELEDLMALFELESVTHLELHGTKINSLLGINGDVLERIELLFTSLQDSTDIFSFGRRIRGTLIGNPWTPLSWGALITEVGNGQLFLDIGLESAWEECLRLWTDLGACVGTLAGDYGLLVRPGIPTLTQNAYDAIRVPSGTAGAVLDAGDPRRTLDALFHEYRDLIEAPEGLAAISASREVGTAEEARRWAMQSSLSSLDKAALDTFVSRFPRIAFYRASEAGVLRTERLVGYRLPEEYREVRKTLDGWLTGRPGSTVRFDAFESWCPRADRVSRLSYVLGLRGFGDDTRTVLRAAGLAIVGLTVEGPQSTLAMRHADPAVYEYSEDDVWDELQRGREVSELLRPVFRSYAAMLSRVIAVDPWH